MRRQYKNPLVVGVTGGIGSGQSTVCEFLEKMSCKVINADLKAREVIQKDRNLQRLLKNTFGNGIFMDNGELDRKKLAEIAFKDELNTMKLNHLVHPRMVECLIEDMEKARFSKRYPIVIVDAALIYEISIEKFFDYVIVVNAPLNMRQTRVIGRDGMSKRQFMERVNKQIPLEDKVKWADFVINNDGSMEELKERAKEVFQKLMAKQKKAHVRTAN
ncbi:MAG: dephospho-CoA kinase [Calditrichaceae bacterium]